MIKTLSVSENAIAPHSIGMSPSGKAHGFGPCIRGFESLHPSQEKFRPFWSVFFFFVALYTGSMLTILLHSSKTMRPAADVAPATYQAPQLLTRTRELATYMQSLSVDELASCMKLSPKKAEETQRLWAAWQVDTVGTRPAIDAFLGDIYSGLRVASLTDSDRHYANDHLLILSGLYGGLRALDGILPYRLEMGYRFADERYGNLYRFWGDTIAQLIPTHTTTLMNLSAVEYTKAVLPFTKLPVVTPKFLTRRDNSSEPIFVTVHAKIARGAFAHWMMTQRVEDVNSLREFSELGYRYDAQHSTATVPVFVCDTFGGLGLSVRKS